MSFKRIWKGLIVFVLLNIFSSFSSITHADTNELNKKTVNLFPILMYDSDIGFGLGGKSIIKNYLKRNESFDLILFGSTKGEQWIVFNLSFPDAELRHDTIYPISIDLKCEYDKILKSNFFGFGNDSVENKEQFPKEFTKLELLFGHAFTRQVIGETGFTLNHTSVYDFTQNSVMANTILGSGESLTLYFTLQLRWDTRNNQIHPDNGHKISLTVDFASPAIGSDYEFKKYNLETATYHKLFTSSHILATRFTMQQVTGSPPYFEQSIIGGTWTNRGFKADRFIDKSISLASIEYRYQFHKWIGSVLFIDSGRVYHSLQNLILQNWHNSLGTGLRIYPGDFVVRFDIGISNEGTRLFFNFGHVF